MPQLVCVTFWQGLWSPALLASQGVTRIQPNDLSLGGVSLADGSSRGGGSAEPQPGMLLLTGANTGGKSTLLRAACLAAVMAQAREGDVGRGLAGVLACMAWPGDSCFDLSRGWPPKCLPCRLGAMCPAPTLSWLRWTASIPA